MSNLLDRASIVLTPTGFNNGEALCIKPDDGSGDFDFSRNSAATRVNSQGLVENVQILSSNLVQNGDFSELGSELITNGSFDTDSDWSLGANWNISNGKANAVSALNGARLEQFNLGQSINRPYKVTFSVSNLTQGAFRVFFGSVQSQNITSDGDYTIYLTPTSTSQFFIFSIGTTTGSIDNVSVKEVDPNDEWSMQASWSIANGKASYNGAGNGHYIKQNASLTIGSQYIAKLDILDNSGNFRISVDGGTASYNNYTTGNGTYSFTFVASSSEFFVRASMGFSSDTLSIDNVSVIEITDDTNLPRINYEGFSYDGSGNIIPDSGCGSWLFEPQSTNLITYSEDFSQWGTVGSPTITSNFGISPDGTQNSTRLQFSTSDRIFINVSASGNITFSVYLKGVGQVRLRNNDGSNTKDITLTSEWIRYEFIFNDTITNIQLQQATGTSDFEIWGAQVEQQSYATSYIPTSGTQTTRNSDVCNNGGSLASINSTEGVLYAEIAALADDGTNRYITLSDGTSSNDVRLYFSSTSGFISALIKVGGVTQAFLSTSAYTTTDFNKIAFKYKENDFALWVNGVKVSTDISGNTFASSILTKLNFYRGSTAFPFYGKTKALAVFPYLSDEELTELTTI